MFRIINEIQDFGVANIKVRLHDTRTVGVTAFICQVTPVL